EEDGIRDRNVTGVQTCALPILKFGHQNIVGCFKTDDTQGIKRMKGFLKAHRQNNVKVNPSNIITYTTEEKFTKPVKDLERLLSTKNNSITGIICYNDELALKFINVLRPKNIRVPEDISIVGFDDSHLAEESETKLTTVKHPKSEIGKAAADTILKIIDTCLKKGNKGKEAYNAESIVYTPKIVERNSTKEIDDSKINS